jgi:hypothetical protein
MDLKRAAFWAARSGLGEALAISDVTRRGWERTVGSTSPYVSFRSRAVATRAQVDAALAAFEIMELPSARKCGYLVPREEASLALAVGRGSGDTADVASAKKYLGVTEAELNALEAAVIGEISSVANGLEPAELRKRLAPQIRSFGDEGKKRGVTTSLPLALGRLRGRGDIYALPVNGRLDTERYRYIVWPEAVPMTSVPFREAQLELARRYWDWCGVATLAHFRWFSGYGVGESKRIAAELGLRPVSVLPDGVELLATSTSAAAYREFEIPREADVYFLSSVDTLLLLRRDLPSVLAEADRRHLPLETKLLTEGRGLTDLDAHVIIQAGRVVGVWDYDFDAAEVIAAAWGSVDRDRLRSMADALAEWIRAELGDFRSVSLDSPASRRPKLAAMRELSGAL